MAVSRWAKEFPRRGARLKGADQVLDQLVPAIGQATKEDTLRWIPDETGRIFTSQFLGGQARLMVAEPIGELWLEAQGFQAARVPIHQRVIDAVQANALRTLGSETHPSAEALQRLQGFLAGGAM